MMQSWWEPQYADSNCTSGLKKKKHGLVKNQEKNQTFSLLVDMTEKQEYLIKVNSDTNIFYKSPMHNMKAKLPFLLQ